MSSLAPVFGSASAGGEGNAQTEEGLLCAAREQLEVVKEGMRSVDELNASKVWAIL